MSANPLPLVLPLQAVGLDALAEVGGKNASLGELMRALSAEGIRVPDGFAVTASAYRQVINAGDLRQRLSALLDGLDSQDIPRLKAAAAAARALVSHAPLPADLQQQILTAYRRLGSPAVAVRSSATAEDLPEASFAGQQETYLNVCGEAALLQACQRCFASLFTDRAIVYRQLHGYHHLDVALSIGVQQMVRADLACSGVMFTLDTDSGFRDVVLLSATYGLGEPLVQGAVNPDELLIFKPTLLQGYAPIVGRRLGSKAIRMVLDGDALAPAKGGTHCEPVPQE
ncbi:MAG: phosphoenolpyruvate synthase, partial [Cyanobacteriota bacterium]